MAHDLLTGKPRARDWSIQISGFGDDAREAIQRKPDYFVWWYTTKSIGLGAAVGLIGFLLGRESMRTK